MLGLVEEIGYSTVGNFTVKGLQLRTYVDFEGRCDKDGVIRDK